MFSNPDPMKPISSYAQACFIGLTLGLTYMAVVVAHFVQ
jgi:hypothetical protein